MNHWIILPILIPFLTAILVPALGFRSLSIRRSVSIAGSLILLLSSAWLVSLTTDGQAYSYALSNWAAPFGISLVLDPLSSLMVLLAALVGFFGLLYACGRFDDDPFFHLFYQMQFMGICGAFLTGDIFNLFVFFEIMLLASYTLLVSNGQDRQVRVGIHYVFLNLAGSSLFLVGVGVLYGVTGTLSMADMALRVAALEPAQTALIQAGGLILAVVFLLKAAILPLYLWLPQVYSAAPAPVAAAFALLTKVGIYAILRVSTLIFGPDAGIAADLFEPYLLPLALLTLIFGMIGAAGSTHLRNVIGYLIIASLGTMLAAFGLFTVEGIAAGLYYLPHSTVIIAFLFLLSDQISLGRGAADDRLVLSHKPHRPIFLGLLFFIGAIAVAGLPPFSGFIGKLLILQAALSTPAALALWFAVLSTSWLVILILSRAGTLLFWKADAAPVDPPRPAAARTELTALFGLLACIVLYSFFAGPITGYYTMTAEYLLEPARYLNAVLDLP